MLLGCDLERLDPFTLNLLTNDEVLAVDQDEACTPAYEAISHGDIRIIVKELADGSQAIGLFNLGSAPALATAKIPGKHSIRDLWRQKDLGEYQDEFQAMVPSHGVVMIKVSS
jgi:alpha-galactosidase